MTTTEEPPARAREAPIPVAPRRRRRLSGGHLVMIVAALVAIVANYAVLRAGDDTVRVAVAASELTAGQPVSRASFTFTDVRVADELLTRLLQPADLADIEGWVPVSTVGIGEVVRRADLQAPSAPQHHRAMSIPIDAAHAVAGALRRGDRVDVIEVDDRSARYLVTDAQVLDVPSAAPSGIQSGLRAFSVTIAVDDETALRLAVAIRSGQLEIVRSTGADAAMTHEVDGGADDRTDDATALPTDEAGEE